ncbi:MAG: hypothetical protein IPH33_01660 [Bacteroidetes bacterium]|nr:hypothetical protein [Bacteroidota bacterium]
MPGRQFNAGTYRHGFNGKENDNEVKGVGNQQDYGMRVYDGRIARFLSVDPIQKEYPELTPYQFAGNTPIQAVDLDGKEVYDYRLDLNDKGQNTSFIYMGENTHGLNGWSIWNLLDMQIPGVDVYQNKQFIGRYTFNTASQGGFLELYNFVSDKEIRTLG